MADEQQLPTAQPFPSVPILHGIRALAIMLVFVAHAGLNKIVPGGLGVTIFFFLSGYLITSLMRVEFAQTEKVNLRKFYARRSLRIFHPFTSPLRLEFCWYGRASTPLISGRTLYFSKRPISIITHSILPSLMVFPRCRYGRSRWKSISIYSFRCSIFFSRNASRLSNKRPRFWRFAGPFSPYDSSWPSPSPIITRFITGPIHASIRYSMAAFSPCGRTPCSIATKSLMFHAFGRWGLLVRSCYFACLSVQNSSARRCATRYRAWRSSCFLAMRFALIGA